MARKNALISVAHNAETNALTFNVGEAGSFELTVADLSDDIRNHALIHGLVQKVSDAAAISKDDLTGDPAKDAVTKLEAMTAVRDRLVAGDWSKRSGDGSGPVAGIIYRSFERWVFEAKKIANPTDEQREKVRIKYDAMTRAEQLALRNVPAIAKIMDELRAEKPAAKSVDTSAMLKDIGL